MAKDEVAFVEHTGKDKGRYKRGALWGMEISGQVLKIESLFLRVWFSWIVVVSLYFVVPMIN